MRYFELFIKYSLINSFIIQPFITTIDDVVCVGSLPLQSDVEYLISTHRIGCVINMCREYGGPTEKYSEYLIEQLWLPTPDLSEPRLEDIESAVSYIEDFRSRCPGERVFIHCKGGRGRAIIVTLCYLISVGMKQQQAMDFIKSKRAIASTLAVNAEVVRLFIQRLESVKSLESKKSKCYESP